MNYHISPRARLDLIEIWEYTFKKWSVAQADTYYRIIVEHIKEVSAHPNIAVNYDQSRKGYRGFRVKSHIIFFRIADDDKVEIVRVLHKTMDVESRMDD